MYRGVRAEEMHRTLRDKMITDRGFAKINARLEQALALI